MYLLGCEEFYKPNAVDRHCEEVGNRDERYDADLEA